jgi:hypothetical protein
MVHSLRKYLIENEHQQGTYESYVAYFENLDYTKKSTIEKLKLPFPPANQRETMFNKDGYEMDGGYEIFDNSIIRKPYITMKIIPKDKIRYGIMLEFNIKTHKLDQCILLNPKRSYATQTNIKDCAVQYHAGNFYFNSNGQLVPNIGYHILQTLVRDYQRKTFYSVLKNREDHINNNILPMIQGLIDNEYLSLKQAKYYMNEIAEESATYWKHQDPSHGETFEEAIEDFRRLMREATRALT